MERFIQTFGRLPDVYAADHVLRATLDRLLGPDRHAVAAGPLAALAADMAGPLRAAHADAEAHPPELVRYDGWGARIDRVRTSTGWETLRRAAAGHGLVALPYEESARAAYGAGARVVQHALLHLYGLESATFSCPVAMSDGAAALLCRPDTLAEVRAAWLPRLLSRDPGVAVTSGQWMTETTGGSDVGGTGTVARRDADGSRRLTGEKWFCSAIDSAVAVALARPEGAPAGSRGLACFLVPRYAGDTPEGRSGNAPLGATAPGLRLHRLKDKLGTRALPSAEVGLDGAYAVPVSDPGVPGLAKMMTLVQLTRLHNSAAAAASMRRGLSYVRHHAETREAFGRPLWRQPLHRETLSWLAVDAEAAFTLAALCFATLGRVEVDGDPQAQALLRLAATLAKAATAKLAVAAASEFVECVGGNGYIEDTGFPRLLRDAQVLPIWEGTTNVLSLDVLRALTREPEALPAYLAALDSAADAAVGSGDGGLKRVADDLSAVRSELVDAMAALSSADPARAQAGARELLLRMAYALAAAGLTEQAAYEIGQGNARAALVASLWVRRRLLGDPCTGLGDERFAHLVDGEPL